MSKFYSRVGDEIENPAAMEYASDVAKVYTVTLPNGKTQKFEECKNGQVCYAGTCKVADKFFTGLEQVKAMGGKVEVETI